MINPIDALLQNPPFLYAFVAMQGLLVGSFLNVVILRLPKMLEREWLTQSAQMLDQEPPHFEPFNLAKPDSTCPGCGHKIRAWENIPVISYLFLRGRCSACRTRISPRYPIIELVSSILSVAVIYQFGPNWTGLMALFLTWSLISLTMIDADTQLLPDRITLPLLWLGLTANSFGLFTSLDSALWGAIAGYLSLWLVYHLFRLLTGKEGMGYGDFKLLAALGAWMGWQYLPMIILLSSLVGALIGIALIVIRGRDRNIPIPFGPYLAIAGWIALIWGEPLLRLWLGSMGGAA
jgi:leader peptidase (prepilin peptidase)/N-methyltransferase